MRVFGLIPAAGKSRRMGRPKLLLPLGGITVLEQVVRALRTGGVEECVVVVAPEALQLAEVARQAGSCVCVLSEETPDMRASCQAGLRWIEQARNPTEDDAVLLLPADHPTLTAEVVVPLLARAREHREMGIFVPTWEGKRGHPTLFRWRYAKGILEVPEGEGLNRYFRRLVDETCEVPAASAEVLRDLDTPEDWDRLIREMESKEGGSNPPSS